MFNGLLLSLSILASQGDTTKPSAIDSVPAIAVDTSAVVDIPEPVDPIFDTTRVDLSNSPDAPAVIEMNKRIGEYYLYWSTLYKVYISNDAVTVIEPPDGYTIEAAIIGNSKLFAVNQAKNRISLKKLAFDDVNTTLILLLSNGIQGTKSVAIDIKSSKKLSTSIAKLVVPNNQATNKVIETMKARYLDQMNGKLQSQEITLNNTVRLGTIFEQDVFRIPEDLDETQTDYKGASFRLDAVVNSQGETFVYTSTDAVDAECQVVDLLRVEDPEQIMKKRAELVYKKKFGKRTQLIYKVSRVTPGKWNFVVRIWSKELVIKTQLQLSEKK